MRAKREAAAGRWRLIHGDHPCDVVHVELPQTDLAKLKRHAAERAECVPSRPLKRGQERIAELKRYIATASDLAAALAKVQSLEAELARLMYGHVS